MPDCDKIIRHIKRYSPEIYFRYEWSDWLTPIGLKKQTKRRFDTIFYIAFQETMLETSLDNKEITSMQFADPIDIMQRHLNGELWLAPPQFWEISRMINIHNFNLIPGTVLFLFRISICLQISKQQ